LTVVRPDSSTTIDLSSLVTITANIDLIKTIIKTNKKLILVGIIRSLITWPARKKSNPKRIFWAKRNLVFSKFAVSIPFQGCVSIINILRAALTPAQVMKIAPQTLKRKLIISASELTNAVKNIESKMFILFLLLVA